MIKKIEKIEKRFFWLAILGVGSAILYFLTNAWGKVAVARDVQFSFENYIPFVPGAIIAYLLIFPFLLTPVFLVKKYRDFATVVVAYAALIIVSLLIFFRFPTTMERPDAAVHGFVGWLFGAVRAVDGKCNLFPSLHVSSVVYVALVNGFFCPKAKCPSWVCAALISVSTLLVKQHAAVDVLGGALFGIAAYKLLLWLLRR